MKQLARLYIDALVIRRTIALTLLAFLGLAVAAPLLSWNPEANLPPCCRRHGKHHCMMRMMRLWDNRSPGFAAVSERCPCPPAVISAAHSSSWKPETAALIYAEIARHPACVAQTETLYRLSFQRSRQKRGPPAFFV